MNGTDQSQEFVCHRGVPQGSKLGPLLFITYTCDLPDAVSSCKLLLYADDTCIYTSASSAREVISALQSDLLSLEAWLSNNLLQLNSKKSEFILFPKYRCSKDLSLCSVKIGSSVAQPVASVRYLGIHFDSRLCWQPHLDKVFNQVSKKIGVLYRCRQNLSTEAKSAYINSIVHSGMDYCSVVWSDNSPGTVNRLRLLEKRSLRVAAGLRRCERTGDIDDLRCKLGLSSFTLRHKKQLGFFVFKCINGIAPTNISSRFRLITSLDNHPQTRLTQRGVQVDFPRTNALKSTLTYRGQQLWNSLPSSVRLLPHEMIQPFKLRLQDFLKTIY